MVLGAESERRTLLLLAQDCAQPSPDEAVEETELGWDSMLEIVEPSAERRIELAHDPFQAVAPAAPRRGAHSILERFQALLAHVSTPRLEPVAEEIEPLPRFARVADLRLVRMQRQAVGRRPRRDLAERDERNQRDQRSRLQTRPDFCPSDEVS